MESYAREEKYWSNNVNTVQKDETRMETKRLAGEGGTRRNKSSASYNILTLDYEQSPQGQALQYKVRCFWRTTCVPCFDLRP
jgi:hypothetical protein